MSEYGVTIKIYDFKSKIIAVVAQGIRGIQSGPKLTSSASESEAIQMCSEST